MVSADGPTLFDLNRHAGEGIEWVLVTSITTDHRVNTRPVESAWVEQKYREGFDPTKIGVPILSHREDGTYVWLDGQHRGALIRRAGWVDQKIQCRVFYGLSISEEARMFLGHNDNRQVKPIYKFLARVTTGEEEAVAITAIVRAAGWHISDSTGPTSIPAVRALEKAYATTPDQPGKALTAALRLITQAWGYKAEAVKGPILHGISMVYARFGDQIDNASLTKKLAQFPSGPAGLYGKARGMQQFQGGILAHCVAEVVVTTYNTRRRNGGLPDWR